MIGSGAWIDWAAWRERALRPSATLVAVSLHAMVLMGVALPHPQLASPAENLEITIEPQQGDVSPDASQTESQDSIAQAQTQPDVKPDPRPEEPKLVDPPPPPPPPPEKVEDKPQPVAAEAPKREVDDAPEIARRQEREREKRIERQREKKREQAEERRQEQKREERRERRIEAQKAAAQSARHARAGVADGAHNSGLSRATFGSRMLAEIRRHQIHAASQGSVRVAFTVGGSGAVSSAHVVSSSGDGSLDATAVRIVRSCHPGPPPGGSYSASATINFR